MIIRIVKMTFLPEKVDQFLEIFNDNKHHIRNMEGCSHVELLKDVSQQNVYFTYSYWESETDLNTYRNSDFFTTVWAKSKMLFAAKAEAWSLTRV
jgi:heme-degrading monooxygenase HmoA